MPKYAFFTTINRDGVGDFSHLEDMLKKLCNDPDYKDIELIAMVQFRDGGKESSYQHIAQKVEKLKEMGITIHYGTEADHKNFQKNEDITNQLQDVSQVISVSFGQLANNYKRFIKQAIYKSIGEHETALSNVPDCIKFGEDYPLGIGDGTYGNYKNIGVGIKISQPLSLSPEEAWHTIEQNDPVFLNKIYALTNTTNFSEFDSQYILVPAYFTDQFGGDINNFIKMLASDNSLNKEIIIYQSGFHMEKMIFEHYQKTVSELLIRSLKQDDNSQINQLEIITPDAPIKETGINPKGAKTIKICTGFYLSDQSFGALFSLAKIAAVSGDNTLEHCMSENVLPYYFSTNHAMKIPTGLKLYRIINNKKLQIPLEVQQSFEEFLLKSTSSCSTPDYNKINIAEMVKHWPKVTQYLREHHNFYDKMNHILMKDLACEQAPPALIPIVISSQLDSCYSETKLSNIIKSDFFPVLNESNDEIIRIYESVFDHYEYNSSHLPILINKCQSSDISDKLIAKISKRAGSDSNFVLFLQQIKNHNFSQESAETKLQPQVVSISQYSLINTSQKDSSVLEKTKESEATPKQEVNPKKP